MKKLVIIFLMTVFIFSFSVVNSAETDEVCFDCHSDKSLYSESGSKKKSLFIDKKVFDKSIHLKSGCIGCHTDVDPENLPHEEKLKKVNCAKCHESAVNKYKGSLHAKAHEQGKYLAPNCQTCHGKHNILSSKNQKSNTYVMNIPKLCGNCHKEGTPVSQLKYISKRHVLEDYSQSIHGDGLYKRGLTVTAVCTSCHMSHDILPHENKNSSINRYNIPTTCMQCHTNIEKVHTKVIDGKLWEKKPHDIPVCVDCHQPHKTRKILYEGSYTNDYCLKCHSDNNIKNTKNGKDNSLFVNYVHFSNSVHKSISCIKCHTKMDINKKPVCKSSGKVDCSMCHSERVAEYELSTHGTLYKKGDNDAPYCTDCHETHTIKSKKDQNSPTYSKNIPNLCGTCHQEGKPATKHYKGKEHEVVNKYSESIHGKGLLESGLVVTATCIDCHTSHSELPAKDPRSSVNRNNIPKTCAKCHTGIYEEISESVHSMKDETKDKRMPVCHDCHQSHNINRVDLSDFRNTIITQCGRCHKNVAESYFDTFHGKVSKLGSEKTAKCFDCHGAHNILPVSNPKSKLSRQNIVETCKTCHENSNKKFVGYLTHATHHNKNKYPILFYTFWFMTILLVGTFSFFGLHTLLWLPRAIMEKRKRIKEHKNEK